MSSFKRACVRVLLFFTYVLGIYYIWSRIGRVLFEIHHTGEADQEFEAEKIQEFLDTCTWRKDPWWHLGDMISRPRKFEVTKRGDCDEFAVTALSKGRHGIKYKGRHYFRLGLLTVNFTKKGTFLSGHNVALFRTDLPDGSRSYIHLSNWGIYGPFAAAEEAAKSVWEGAQADPCGYRVTTSNLRQRIFHKIW